MQQRTAINPEIIQELLDSTRNAADRGQSQFFTPPALAALLGAAFPKYRETVVDLTCGNGQLLAGVANQGTACLLGADIDPCRSADGVHVQRITRDLTHFYPLLVETRFTADLFALNPPWGMEWHRDRLKELADSPVTAVRHAFAASAGEPVIDSTIATLMIALDRCTSAGEGLLIANHATLERLVFAEGAPCAALAEHIWLHLILDGNPMTGETTGRWVRDRPFYTSVLFCARTRARAACRARERCDHT